MNAFASECSSGCESGWTMYLEQSFLNQNGSHRDNRFYDECKEKRVLDEEEEAMDEDLSMVSDASSGPPHFPDDEDNGCFYPQISSKTAKPQKTGKEKKKVEENQHLVSLLDDTASSPVYDFSKNSVTMTNQQGSTESFLDYSQGFSATYFEERSSFPDHFGYMQSSMSQNELQNNQWYGGKMR
ncbi:protein SOB FIVE-LIKE 5-like isoform X2 [Prosopis cineraria]|uniref:protein SOB FIVE-LIKE 5-like isoform X2 n=1 Tax=Prosopis cineraria TaxID=364024 RepID=UPI00240F0B2B|nr:protein SOB FIVE-LIKE 5-like isoform X2 [Prosopis cineraria]